jgi:hypothetical protein
MAHGRSVIMFRIRERKSSSCVIDFTQNLDALQRVHRQRLTTTDRKVIQGVDGDMWGTFITSETFPSTSSSSSASFRGEPIPKGERSFFALREGEKPRRKKKS